MKNLMERLPLWKIGELLVGLTIMVSGAYVAWLGVSRLRELWVLYASFFPIALPEDVGQRILNSLPMIVAVFINTVASVAAVLMGATWALSGLAEAFETRKKPPDPADFQQPELVAESLRTAQGQYWKASSLLAHLAGRLAPRARLISPVSYQILSGIWGACWRISLAGLFIWGALAALEMAPGLLKRYVQIDLTLVIPSPKPLLSLLGFLLLVYFLIAISLIPIKRPQFLRTTEYVPVRGSGDPQAFFALVEEGCRLLTAVGSPHRHPIRLEEEGNLGKKASLIETSAEPLKSVARPVAYCCLPLTLILLTNGFSRLVYFHKSTELMPWAEFLTKHLPNYLMEAGFALALIIVAMHLAERARRLFGVRRYRSGLILLHVQNDQDADQALASEPEHAQPSRQGNEVRWKPADAADARFADWVRAPNQSRRFTIQALWAQVVSESAGADSPRFLIDLRQSKALDAAMQHIINIPFHVAFEPDDPASLISEHGRNESPRRQDTEGSDPGEQRQD